MCGPREGAGDFCSFGDLCFLLLCGILQEKKAAGRSIASRRSTRPRGDSTPARVCVSACRSRPEQARVSSLRLLFSPRRLSFFTVILSRRDLFISISPWFIHIGGGGRGGSVAVAARGCPPCKGARGWYRMHARTRLARVRSVYIYLFPGVQSVVRRRDVLAQGFGSSFWLDPPR